MWTKPGFDDSESYLSLLHTSCGSIRLAFLGVFSLAILDRLNFFGTTENIKYINNPKIRNKINNAITKMFLNKCLSLPHAIILLIKFISQSVCFHVVNS